MTYRKLEGFEVIQQVRDDYLCTLDAPMDGMWEHTIIAQATFWGLYNGARRLGYFCIDDQDCLLRFYLEADERAHVQETFRWIVATCGISQAIASTGESLYFSLCFDLQTSVVLHSYLFRDDKRVTQSSALSPYIFRKAQTNEVEAITRFYWANTQGPGEWIEAFLHERLDRGELFGFYDEQRLLAAGECIPSQTQPPYADLGMVVAQSHRGKGLGSAVLIHLKEHCYEAGWRPICSCDADNGASKRAIEKAGFISEQQRVTMLFSEYAR